MHMGGKQNGSGPLQPAVDRGGSAHGLPEGFDKEADIFKSAGGGNGGNGVVGRAQQLTGFLNAVLTQVLVGRQVNHAVKAPKAFAFADGRGSGNIPDRNFFGIVVMDVLQQELGPLIPLGPADIRTGRLNGYLPAQEQDHFGKLLPNKKLKTVVRFPDCIPGGMDTAQYGFLPVHFR